MITLTRNAYSMAAEVFNFFNSTVKKTKPKLSFIDPALTDEIQFENITTQTTTEKANVKTDNSTSERGEISTKGPTISGKTAKKERRKAKVQEKNDAVSESSKSEGNIGTSDPSENETNKVIESTTAHDLTSQLDAMSIGGQGTTPKTTKKKRGKK